jgi:hypothetical protein
VKREGPFWDVMEGRAALSPAAALRGWDLVAVNPEAGTIEVAFTATKQFLNPIGVIQDDHVEHLWYRLEPFTANPEAQISRRRVLTCQPHHLGIRVDPQPMTERPGQIAQPLARAGPAAAPPRTRPAAVFKRVQQVAHP